MWFSKLLLLISLSPMLMAITLVNKTAACLNGSQANISATAQNHTGGNLIAVYAFWSTTSTTVSVSDTAGNSYSGVTAYTRGDSGAKGQWFYAKNISGNSSNVVKLTPTGGSFSYPCIYVLQYSGLDTSAPQDADVGQGGNTSGTVTSPSFSTTVANEVILYGLGGNGSQTFTAGTGYGLEAVDGNGYGATEDKIVSSTQSSVTASMGGNNNYYVGAVVSFKAASAGATPACTMKLLGAGPC